MEEAKEMANANEIEDITIYNSANGNLDVGELVAQSFYLDLDDFPHKPGTKPVQISFILWYNNNKINNKITKIGQREYHQCNNSKQTFVAFTLTLLFYS